MTDKEKADCLIDLHKEQLGKFKQTREIEFKVNIALWTIILVSGLYLKEIDFQHFYIPILIFGVLIIVLVFMHYKCWMFPIQRSEDTDDYYIRKYRYEIEKLSGTNISSEPEKFKTINKFRDFKCSSKNWILFEVGITAFLILSVGLYIILTNLK